VISKKVCVHNKNHRTVFCFLTGGFLCFKISCSYLLISCFLLSVMKYVAKKVNLADIGIVGGLEDASNEKEKFSSFSSASCLGSGPGLGFSGGGSAGGSNLSGFGQQQFRRFK
jgi:hypothetical protein